MKLVPVAVAKNTKSVASINDFKTQKNADNSPSLGGIAIGLCGLNVFFEKRPILPCSLKILVLSLGRFRVK